MTNPFKAYITKPEPKENVEEIEGVMACTKCLRTASSGLYYPDEHRVTYTCPEGHFNEGHNIKL